MSVCSGMVNLGCGTSRDDVALGPELRLPPGFSIQTFAAPVERARQMTLGRNGIVYVGSNGGVVHALEYRESDYAVERIHRIATGLTLPTGVAYRNGSLFVSEIDRVLRFDGIDNRLSDPPQPAVVLEGLPADRRHGWKFLAFGPDGHLYVPVGAPCNVCEQDDPRYASILRVDTTSGEATVFARGIRNTVGFDFHPSTGVLWFTDNGRDGMGDDVPPDELNAAARAGMHFGFPYCHGGTVADPEFGGKRSCAEFTAPVKSLGPHVAALGMRFYTGRMFPEEYRNQVLIAEHGSWDRSVPVGYRITAVITHPGGSYTYSPLVEGWLRGPDVSGRPADVLVMPDGSLLISDDHSNVIYRLTYSARAAVQ